MDDTIVLLSADGREFKVEREVAYIMKTVKAALEDATESDVVPVGLISGDTLCEVIEFCKSVHSKSPEHEEKWMTKFSRLDKVTLFHIILAADFLNCTELLDASCRSLANEFRHKDEHGIKAMFGIEGDFTPEEEESVLRDNPFLLEDS
eukprot:c46301_g1_i1.p1 GENE.c46301_g1_i1~~c46301_g1_i1.p1  ORF type:complete len:149 (+),score=42.56 c46301_g1_i1:54-500(+)